MSDLKAKDIREKRKDNIYIANYFRKSLNNLVKCDDILYEYNGMIYQLLTEKKLREKLHLFIEKYLITEIWRETTIKNIFSSLASSAKTKTVKMDSDENLIAFENGILNTKTKEFINFSSKIYISTMVDIKYDKNATKVSEFTKFIDDIVDGDTTQIVNIIMLGGYILCPSLKANKLFLFDGDGGSGKTTLLKVFKMFFNKDKISSLSLKKISTDDNRRTGLIKSRINIKTEAKAEYIDSEDLKNITEGEPITIGQKYKNDIQITVKAKILIASNGLPKFIDKTEGTTRRLIIFKFPKQFLEPERIKGIKSKNVFKEDKELLNKLKKEAPAILNLFLMGLNKLKKRNYDFILSKDILNEYKNYNDSVMEFLDTFYEIDYDNEDNISNKIKISDIMREYRNWMLETTGSDKKANLRPQEFGKRIRTKYKIEGEKMQWTDEDNKYKSDTVYNLKKKKIKEITSDNMEEEMEQLSFN